MEIRQPWKARISESFGAAVICQAAVDDPDTIRLRLVITLCCELDLGITLGFAIQLILMCEYKG